MTEDVQAIISIENITVSYNGEVILKDISLAIEFNQIVGFIGPNGAGKTTLIRTVAGLIKPVAGRIIFWNGKDRNGQICPTGIYIITVESAEKLKTKTVMISNKY